MDDPPEIPITPTPAPPVPTPVGAIAGGVVGGVVAGVLLLLGIILYRRRQLAANTSPEAGMPVGEAGMPVGYAHANIPTPAGHNYGDKDGAAPPYHENHGYTDATGNSGIGQNGIEQVAHELEDPESTVAELGGGEMPGKG